MNFLLLILVYTVYSLQFIVSSAYSLRFSREVVNEFFFRKLRLPEKLTPSIYYFIAFIHERQNLSWVRIEFLNKKCLELELSIFMVPGDFIACIDLVSFNVNNSLVGFKI